MAGLFEIDDNGNVFNTYVTVCPDGYITRFRKLHPFVNPHLSPGTEYNVVEIEGWKIGFLICYDNNLPENVRITSMLGAEVVFMPHVTCGLPSAMPGRGKIPVEAWNNRLKDPVRLRQEFRGPQRAGVATSVVACPGMGKTESTRFFPTRSGGTTTPSNRGWR